MSETVPCTDRGRPWYQARGTVAVMISLLFVLLFIYTIPASSLSAAIPERDRSSAPESATHRWYAGDREGAIQLLRDHLRTNPDDDRASLDLAILLREAGDHRAALEVLTGVYANDAPADEALGSGETASARDGFATEIRMTRSLMATPPEPPLLVAAPETTRDHFWAAVAAWRDGQSATASRFTAAIPARSTWSAYAFAFDGVYAMRSNRYEAAITRFEQALTADRNVSSVRLPLARARYATGDVMRAIEDLRRARIALPWDTSILPQLIAWEQAHPPSEAARAAARAARQNAQVPAVAPVDAAVAAGPRMRIGLAEAVRSVELKPGGAFYLARIGSDIVDIPPAERGDAVRERLADERSWLSDFVTIPDDATLHVEAYDSTIRVSVREATGSERELFRGAPPLRMVPQSPSTTTLVFDVTHSAGQFSGGQENRLYRGHIEFLTPPSGAQPGRFTIVNELSIEEYLYSVVPSEMPAWWPSEALKAQAVAARSYTLHPRRRFESRGFDLVSSVTSAFYRGVTGEDPRTTAAVDATRGLVLQDGRRTLDAVFSANSAGYTESSASVWGFPTALVGVADPQLPALTVDDTPRRPSELYRWITTRPESYAAAARYADPAAYRWSLLVSREDIERRLRAAAVEVGSIRAITPGARGITGRVETVTVVGTEGATVVRRDLIRSRLGGLRSNLFVVAPYYGPDWLTVGANTQSVDDTPSDDAWSGDGAHRSADGQRGTNDRRGSTADEPLPTAFFFEGAGWGHGVGMCQTSAAGMADDGWDAAAILAHFYPRNTLVAWY